MAGLGILSWVVLSGKTGNAGATGGAEATGGYSLLGEGEGDEESEEGEICGRKPSCSP